MAASQNAKMVLSALNRCAGLQRPRALLRAPSICLTRRKHTGYSVHRVQTQPKKPTRGPIEYMKEILDLTNLPPSYVEQFVQKQKKEFNLRTPEGYYQGLMAFTSYVSDHVRPYEDFPPTEKLPKAPVLHDLGCIVMEASRNHKGLLATMLWFTAANWGFAPSVCTMAASLARRGQYGKDKLVRPVEKRFEALVRGGDPTALAIQGDILYRKKEYAEAEAVLNRVRDNNVADGNLGNWGPNFLLTLGKTLGKRGRVAEGAAILRELSNDGYIEADGELGKLLRDTDPEEAMLYLYKAGCTGAHDCFEVMAEIELEKATKATTGQKANEHRLWAQELTRLADKKADF